MATAGARVFFALWPDDPVREALAATAVAAQAACGGRATAPEKIHLTLFFVGACQRSRLSRLAYCAASLDVRPFSLHLSALGYWRHNRIIWAGAAECPELSRLVAELTGKLSHEGVVGEDRPYVPHVTLVRNARQSPSGRSLEVPVWAASELVLVESAPAQRGTRYEIVARFPLGG